MVFTLVRNPNGTRPLFANHWLCPTYRSAELSPPNAHSPTRQSGYDARFDHGTYQINFL